MYLNKINLFLVISFFLSSFFLTLKDVKSYEIKVVDGDTIHLNGKKIRFSGIDTPELKPVSYTHLTLPTTPVV